MIDRLITRKFGENRPRIDRKNDALTGKFGDEWLMNDWWMTDEWTEELAKMDRKLNDELTDNWPIFTRLIYPKFWAKIWRKSTEDWPKKTGFGPMMNDGWFDRRNGENWTINWTMNWPIIERKFTR
jgi:hypothetical protein